MNREPTRNSRREFIRSGVAGTLLASGLFSEILRASDSVPSTASVLDPLAPRAPHFAPKAKQVIFLNMSGGVSHVDSFDPKPRLFSDHGKKITIDHPEAMGRKGYENLYIKRPNWQFSPRGKSGIEVSDLFRHIGSVIDDVTLIRSMQTSHSNHYNATLGMHTGSFNVTRPSIGAWVSYGLGTENRNLPSFVVIAPSTPYAGSQLWGSDFLPGCHQGTRVIPGAEPVADLNRRVATSRRQELELGAIAQLNRNHQVTRWSDPNLAARIKSFETAFGMQMEMPHAFDLKEESDSTHALYGLERGSTKGFAWQCIVARRLIERGVRFVELIDTGGSGNWDSHGDMMDHARLAPNVDRPIAGLITDLKQRGLFDDTLVVWTTEFGRTPFNNSAENKGREHHGWAFSSFLAGAGVKRGHVHGETDEHGIGVAKDGVHVHDFHATILHLMGLDHERLTYRHAGRDFRLTDVEGKVVTPILT
jgi:hypothetical protein